MPAKPDKSGDFLWEKALDGALGQETEQHIAEQQRALAARPHDPQPYFRLGVLYHLQRKTEAAIGMFQQALALDPDFALAHQHLGQLYVVLGDYQRAAEHARQAAARGNTVLLDLLRRYPRASSPSK